MPPLLWVPGGSSTERISYFYTVAVTIVVFNDVISIQQYFGEKKIVFRSHLATMPQTKMTMKLIRSMVTAQLSV